MRTDAIRDVIVVGASAGGVEALRALVAGLPADLPAAVLAVLHVPRSAPSALAAILTRSGPLPARTALDGEPLRRGRIYVAAVDHHLLVQEGRIRITRGPAENGHRPAIDPTFRSAARAYGPRVIGVVLSGARDDGAAGLSAIAEAGGIVVVQEPSDALHPSMPRAALEQVSADHVLPAAAIGPLIAELANTAVDDTGSTVEPLLEAEVAMADEHPGVTTDDLGVPAAGYGCPDCAGALYEMHSSPVPRYRCRVGHAWSPDSLLERHAVALEGALWMALRTLEERRSLSERLASAHAERNRPEVTKRYEALAVEAGLAAHLIRDLISRVGSGSDVEEIRLGE
jgi:two-component system, chemotaxis family, protein-glutamate methylesterase/glutaminase